MAGVDQISAVILVIDVPARHDDRVRALGLRATDTRLSGPMDPRVLQRPAIAKALADRHAIRRSEESGHISSTLSRHSRPHSRPREQHAQLCGKTPDSDSHLPQATKTRYEALGDASVLGSSLFERGDRPARNEVQSCRHGSVGQRPKRMVPLEGFEPPTRSLGRSGSSTELQRLGTPSLDGRRPRHPVPPQPQRTPALC